MKQEDWREQFDEKFEVGEWGKSGRQVFFFCETSRKKNQKERDLNADFRMLNRLQSESYWRR
jgi:hypothetical protein